MDDINGYLLDCLGTCGKCGEPAFLIKIEDAGRNDTRELRICGCIPDRDPVLEEQRKSRFEKRLESG